MTESTTNPELLTDQQITEIEALRKRNTGPSFGYTHELCTAIDSLTATVKQLRAENKTLKAHWADTSEDLASAWLKQRELQSQLEDLRKDNEELSRVIFENEHAQHALSRAVDLCNQKAAEWLAASRAETNDAKSNELYAEYCAARKLAVALEKLT